MMDAGLIQICALTNTAAPGRMPQEKLVVEESWFYEDRVVGYNRLYAARGVNEQIDMLVRIWRSSTPKVGKFAVLSMSENDGQYRITNVQNLLDEFGLKVTDITLQRLEEKYDVATET